MRAFLSKRTVYTGALFLVSSLGGCIASYGHPSDTEKLSVGSQLPASEAEVKVGKAPNNNTSLRLRAQHLAYPTKLNPPGNTYVVWTRPTPQAQAQNIGALTVDKNLNATLSTVTPLQSFEIFITTETSAQVTSPSGAPLMWGTVNR